MKTGKYLCVFCVKPWHRGIKKKKEVEGRREREREDTSKKKKKGGGVKASLNDLFALEGRQEKDRL